MAKIKVIWKDNLEGYIAGSHCTRNIDKASEYPLPVAIGITLRLLEDDMVKDVEIIRNEKDKVNRKKKVFRVWKMLLQDIEDLHSVRYFQEDVKYLIHYGGWMTKCEGKTKEECRNLGYEVNDEWLVEE